MSGHGTKPPGTLGVRPICLAVDPRASRSTPGYALRGIKFLDDRLANPSYAGLLIVGVALVLLGPSEFTQFWIYAAIGLYVVLAVVAFGFYSPTLKRLIAAYETGGAASPEFAALSARSRAVGIFIGVIVLTIIVLMVVKPGGA